MSRVNLLRTEQAPMPDRDLEAVRRFLFGLFDGKNKQKAG